MEVEVETSPFSDRESPPSAELARIRQVYSEDAPEESNREDQVPQISEPALQSSKEGFIRKEDHLGPFTSERIHPETDLQDADLKTSQASPSKRGLDCESGFKGRLLAPQHSERLQTLPGLLLQGPELALQSHAIRTMYSSSDIHQAYQVCSATSGEGRHMVPSVSGRSVDHCILERRMLTEATENWKFSKAWDG